MRLRFIIGLLLAMVLAGSTASLVTAAPIPAPSFCPQDQVPISSLDAYNAAQCATTASEVRVLFPDGRTLPVPLKGYGVRASALSKNPAVVIEEISVFRSLDGSIVTSLGKSIFGKTQLADHLKPLSLRVPPKKSPLNALADETKCSNSEYTLLGSNAYNHFIEPYRWWYNPSNEPSTGNSLARIQDGFRSMSDEQNACGENIANNSAEQYQGTTTDESTVRDDGTCGQGIGRSTIGWSTLNNPTLAITCTYFNWLGFIVKADMKFTRTVLWHTSSSTAGCVNIPGVFDLWGVANHEAGHAFGLGHVNQYSDQVMKPASNTCDFGMRLKGLGDATGMSVLYPF